MKIKVKVEAVFRGTFKLIADDLELDMRHYQEINNRTLREAFMNQYPRLAKNVPMFKFKGVTYLAGLSIRTKECPLPHGANECPCFLVGIEGCPLTKGWKVI